MNFRLAVMEDLPQIKEVYRKIIQDMKANNIGIWNEIYPCEYFYEDIKNKRLYILEKGTEIVSAFALCKNNDESDCVQWEKKDATALYINRFGVNVNYSRKGIGSKMLSKAISLAKENKAEYLRLFVVDINEPAIKFYVKNGFKKASGVYNERIDEYLTLHEYGFEINVLR